MGEGFPESELDLVVAGTEDSVLMVESEARMLSEEIMLGAVNFGHEQMRSVIKMINEFAAEAGVAKMEIAVDDHSELDKNLSKVAEAELREAYQETNKQKRYVKIDAIKKK